jgi:hypothetical protein
MPSEFTSICITQNSYEEVQGSQLLSTSTISCYRPLDVYNSYLIDFGFFCVIIFGIVWLKIKLFD